MIDLRDYGYIDNSTDSLNVSGELIPARITEVHRELYQAVCEKGEVTAAIKGSFFLEAKNHDEFPAVGDFVLLKFNDSGHSLIAKLLPRKSKFSRTDFSGHLAGYAKTVLEQVVAANFDYVFIMASLNYDFNLNRIERYLTASWQSGAIPVVVLTKADIVDDYSEQVRTVSKIAKNVKVIPISSRTGAGLDSLNEYLQAGKTIVFLGSSGVGKSSLVNALANEELMKVNDIREDDSKGRHTTTYRQLFRLKSGALIIDTPGMRELGLWNANEGISETFSEIEELFADCKFSDCRHKTEPGCAVLAALENGTLSQERWKQYLAQKNEVSFAESKTAYLRDKKQWHKSIAKFSRQIKQNGGI